MSNLKGKKQRHDTQDKEADTDDPEELTVGGRMKNWTQAERTQFFTWMLASDAHWSAYQKQKAAVFRQCAAALFPGKKSRTSLKCHYKRSLDLFMQLYAFQQFTVKSSHLHEESMQAQFNAGRVAGLNLTGLTTKVINRWYELGWFDLFEKRYCLHNGDNHTTSTPERPISQPPVESGASPGMHVATDWNSTIDPQLVATRPSMPDQTGLGDTEHEIHQSVYPCGGVHDMQMVTELAKVTGSLLEVCTSLKDLIKQQAEESKVRTELMQMEENERINWEGRTNVNGYFY
ncbi:hypothetical protein K466DRAFT_605497 [Polyporus arcularius HHB13444]|uniref:Myb/SANT-like domain-containing protein n=1 Tax=Polyporus arcularius HHB13444 TaxID=1314778 RepID=A0A5C3NW68_9APHY|nr:hypothetical protein K466DRAFT_605497 [Polyporus arcularius HHB13444]